MSRQQAASKSVLGIAGHLAGQLSLTGYNGLGTYEYRGEVKDFWDLGIFTSYEIERSYGGVSTGVDKYKQGNWNAWKVVEAGVAVNEEKLEGVATAGTEVSIVELLERGSKILNRIPKLRTYVRPQLERLIKLLRHSSMPEVKFRGKMYIYIGIANNGRAYIRIGSEGEVELKIKQQRIANLAEKMGIPTSASFGRSWQIQVANAQHYMPTAPAY
jgi:hypothetical protein